MAAFSGPAAGPLQPEGDRTEKMGVEIFNQQFRGFRPRGEIEAVRTDVRSKTMIWLVFRRVSAKSYDLMGAWVDTPERSGEELAASTCLDETYYIGPFPMNVALPERPVPWKGSYCPVKRQRLLEEKKKKGANK